ncbi:MAG: hypothetical protein ACLPYW_10115 [Acidimicrobiales bacterium]
MNADDRRRGSQPRLRTRTSTGLVAKRLALVTLLAGILVALLALLAPPASASPILHPKTRVAAIAEPTGQLVGPHADVLAVQGRERAPNYDSYATGSSVAAEGGASGAETAEESEADVTFGHGARHLAGTGLDQADVEGAIESQVRTSASAASSTGSFWGRVVVDGQTVEYRAYTLPNGTINVGTYYVP